MSQENAEPDTAGRRIEPLVRRLAFWWFVLKYVLCRLPMVSRIWIGFAVAHLLGYRRWPSKLNDQQRVWGRSQMDADECRWGNSVRCRLPKWLGNILRPW